MLAFPPPAGYSNRVHSAINKFTWINKPPRNKLATLQRARNLGGQNMPNLKYYFWSFTMKTLSSWLNPEVGNAWHPIEESRVKSHCLEDVVYSNILLTHSLSWHNRGKEISGLSMEKTSVTEHTTVVSITHGHVFVFGEFCSLNTWCQTGECELYRRNERR